jgi:hypothetical protein
MGIVYFRVFLTQLPLYGFIIGCAYAAFLAISRRNYLLALFFAAIVLFPFVNYVYSFVDARVLAPHARTEEVASWRRVSITHGNKPRAFITTWGSDGLVAKTLVVLGRFEKAYGLIGDDWYYFERTPGTPCAETQYDVRMLLRLREPTPCVSATKVGRRVGRQLNMPEVAEPHLRLLADADAPSHHESDKGGIFASSTLELRLVSGEGNKLVSFWEAPYFDAPVFPPILILREGWFREPFAADHAPRPDVVKFVLDALGDT